MKLSLPDFIPIYPEIADKSRSTQVRIDVPLPPEISMILTALRLQPSFCNYFYSAPRHGILIHTDGINPGRVIYPADFQPAKLNFVSGGEDAHMKWWQYCGREPMKPSTSRAGTPFFQFESSQCVELHSSILQGANLVNSGIPHSINSRRQPRHCLSYGLKMLGTDLLLDYREALQIFQSAGLTSG